MLLTPLLPWLVALPGGAWALPLLAPLPLYPAFARRVRERRYGAAWLLAMAWAALLSAGVIILLLVRPALAMQGILNGPAYRTEMAGWILTGEGKEVSPALFVPEHLLHLGAFLLAYMSFFVGSVAAASAQPLLGGLAAWVPWSVIRVMAFVLLGTLLARPLLVRQRWPFERREGLLFALAFAGIAADLTMKTLLAPYWGQLLRGMLQR